MEGLTRGQIARRAQINLETVRFYEQDERPVMPVFAGKSASSVTPITPKITMS
jgi:hypothetical protein